MIKLTDTAITEVKKIIADSELQNGYLRVAVVGGGCSGMSYALNIETDAPKNTDKIEIQDGVRVVVDAKSALFLQGVTLHHTSGLNGKGFEFVNPNAKRTCGCGSSFAC